MNERARTKAELQAELAAARRAIADLEAGEAEGRRLILVDIDRLMSIKRDSARDEKRVA